MKTITIPLLLQCAGILHLGLVAAGLAMPKVVNLRLHIATMPGFIQRLFWVYYAFIGLCLIGFGSMSFFLADRLADGSALARSVCIFLTAFWTVRLIAATFVFDVRPYLTTPRWKFGYHLTNVVFFFLPLVYLIAAWKGGTL